MATLTPLKDKIKSIVDGIESIKLFVYDDLSQVNADSQAIYPLLLLKPPVGEYQEDILNYKIFDVDMFVFIPEMNDNTDKWTEIADKCEDLMIQVLRELFTSQPDFCLSGKLKTSPGHLQHNAKLVGCRAQFKLRVFNPC